MKLKENTVVFDSEVVILGAALNNIDSANIMFEKLEVAHFADPRNMEIFTAMKQVYNKDSVIDLTTIYSILKKNEVKNVSAQYLMDLSQAAVFSSDIEFHINICIDAYKNRTMVSVLKESIAECQKNNTQSFDVYTATTSKLDCIFNSSNETNALNIHEIMDSKFDKGISFMEYVEKRQEIHKSGHISINGLQTEYPILDEVLDGLNDSHFIVVGARPGNGKSTFAVNLALNLANKDIPIGIFSLEMKNFQWVMKMLCVEAGVDDRKVKSGIIDTQEYHALYAAEKKLRAKKVLIDEQGGLTISQICARAKRMVSVNGIKVLFIDYLTRISADKKLASKQEEVQEVSMKLCDLAKKLNIPIVCLAQLNRDIEKNAGESKEMRAPRKSDLRESGQIEADAHSILLLHKPDKYDKMRKPGILEIHIVKNRFGPETRIDFEFKEELGKINELPPLAQLMENRKESDYA